MMNLFYTTGTVFIASIAVVAVSFAEPPDKPFGAPGALADLEVIVVDPKVAATMDGGEVQATDSEHINEMLLALLREQKVKFQEKTDDDTRWFTLEMHVFTTRSDSPFLLRLEQVEEVRVKRGGEWIRSTGVTWKAEQTFRFDEIASAQRIPITNAIRSMIQRLETARKAAAGK